MFKASASISLAAIPLAVQLVGCGQLNNDDTLSSGAVTHQNELHVDEDGLPVVSVVEKRGEESVGCTEVADVRYDQVVIDAALLAMIDALQTVCISKPIVRSQEKTAKKLNNNQYNYQLGLRYDCESAALKNPSNDFDMRSPSLCFAGSVARQAELLKTE